MNEPHYYRTVHTAVHMNMSSRKLIGASLSLLPVIAVCSNIPSNIFNAASKRHLSQCSADQSLSEVEKAKRLAGYKSIDNYVKSDMIVGLGTGSTAKYAVERLGAKLAAGELTNIIAIPTSVATEKQARQLNIPLATLNEYSHIDVAIDGADQIDDNYNLVKGGGGALLREKMVEKSAKTFIVIADSSKVVDHIGPGFPIPVEIVPFCHEHTIRVVEALPSLKGSRAVLRRGSVSNNKLDGNDIAITDNGNYIIDLHFANALQDINQASAELTTTVGVIEHGLFVNMASAIILANTSEVSIIDCKKEN